MKANKIDLVEIINKLKSFYVVELILIIIGVILRLKLYLFNLSFYCDECSLGVNLIDRDYLGLFAPLGQKQCAPPFFLVICKLILDLSHQQGNLYTQDLVLRAFPLFCSIASLPLFAIFLNKITSNKIFIWVCISMLAFNTCTINYSVLLKQYSCELMFTLILLLIFQCFDINKLSKKILGLYSFLFCISIWFSNTAFIILATGLLYFFFKSFYYDFRKQINSNLSKISIIAIPFILNLIIYYFCFFKAVYNSEVYTYMVYSWTKTLPSFLSLDNFFILFARKLNGLIKISYLPQKFIFYFFLLNIVILLASKKNLELKTKFFVIVPIFLSIIASFLKLYPFHNRLILFSLPLYIILYCQAIYFVKSNKFFEIATILILAVLSINKLYIPTTFLYYSEFDFPLRNTAEFIKQNKIPANKIIIAVYELDYYMRPLFKSSKTLLYDTYWEGFKKSKIPQTIKGFQNSDYYILVPNYHIFYDYYTGLLNYLDKNSHIKILQTYTHNGFIYIIHFEKIF